MGTPENEEAPGRTLLMALGAMAGVALVVGVILGLVVMAVVRLSGVGEASTAADQAPESLYLPSYQPTKSPQDDGLGLPGPTTSPSRSPSTPPSTPTPSPERIELVVAPHDVAPGQRIDFRGVYEAGDGVSLQIQRKEDGVWSDFPVTTTVHGGTFDTWIETTHTGRTPYRVYDVAAGRASNVVVLTIR
jgi:hypothetical protein